MFASREDAGNRLGRYLAERAVRADVVLGLPRGGVIVAAGVSRALGLPLDVLLVRKVGHPFFREFAVGAVAEHGVVILDEQSLGGRPGARSALEAVLREETERLEALERSFAGLGRIPLAGSAVLLVDDGLATGATTEAAVRAAWAGGASAVTVAVPVASETGARRLERVATAFLAMWVDRDFEAVGQYYSRFGQTSDEEVLAALRAARGGKIAGD